MHFLLKPYLFPHPREILELIHSLKQEGTFLTLFLVTHAHCQSCHQRCDQSMCTLTQVFSGLCSLDALNGVSMAERISMLALCVPSLQPVLGLEYELLRFKASMCLQPLVQIISRPEGNHPHGLTWCDTAEQLARDGEQWCA